ncbi:MAG: aromatic ring-hydroxylating dioxygenase subunit alpha [Rhodospirillaceae bacterium]|nr:MAG: aromatic ring-hydroxylating dioxygenase subunit alpha [Rhodospirillaceae bacterium]
MQPTTYQLPSNEDVAGLGTTPIPAGPYYRDDYFELEREAIFRRTWIQIGHVCELPEPGSFIVRPIEVANASILITRGKDEKVRAFHNVCTHRGTHLVAEESGNRASFTCRYHSWTFGYDGALRSAPDFERFYVDKSDCGLRPVAVDVCAGLIFVNLDKSPAQGLGEFLGPIAEQLETLSISRATTFAEYVYEIDANWKLTFDNFQEHYHLRFIHPRTGAGARGPDNPFAYPVKFDFYGPHRTESVWSNPAADRLPIQQFALGRLAQIAAADVSRNSSHAKDVFFLFPSLFIQGTPVLPFVHSVMPISATRSRGVVRLYWIGEDDNATESFAREYSMAMARDVHAEDRVVIEAGQRGLNSGALEFIHFQSQEVLCRHLFHAVDTMVQAHRAGRGAAGVVA